MNPREIDLFIKEENRKNIEKFEKISTKSDITLLHRLYQESQDLGYDIQYPYDFMYIGDKANDLIPVIIKHIGKFDNEGISDQLRSALGLNKFYEATEFLLNEFMKIKSKTHDPRRWSIAQAIYKIKDKRFIDGYIDLIKDEDYRIDTDWFVLLLGKWKNEKALPTILELLSSNEKQTLMATIQSLGNYRKKELDKYVEPFLSHKDRDIRKRAESALKKTSS